MPWRRAVRCAVCDLPYEAARSPICAGCRADFFSAAWTRCSVCALRLPEQLASRICGRCQRNAPQFDATLALSDYAAPVDGMIVALKFRAQLALAPVFGALLAERAAALPGTKDALVLSVPLAFERQAERGFNQAQEIAHVLARRLGRPCVSDLLLRVRHTDPQQSMAFDARRRNVRKAFALATNAEQRIEGKTLLVVDDVMTTGSTLDELAGLLKRAGAGVVINLVVARTP